MTPTGEPMRQGDTFVDSIGPVWRDVNDRWSRIRLVIERRHTNPTGQVHGGVIMTLLDLALGGAIEGAIGRGGADGLEHPVTVQLACNLLAAASLGEAIVAEGHVDRIAKTLAFSSGRVMAGDRLLATASAVFKVRR